MGCVCFYILGVPEGSTDSGSGKAWERTCDPLFTRQSAYPLHRGGL